MPSRSFTVSGWRPTGARRIVQGWFFARVEELWESHDGAREWRRAGMLKISDEFKQPEGPPPPARDE